MAAEAAGIPGIGSAHAGRRTVLTAPLDKLLATAAPWPYVRPLQVEDLPWLALAVWEEVSPGPTDRDWDATVTFTQEVLRGDRGEFVPVASPVAVTEAGEIAGAIATVLSPDRDHRPTVLLGLTLPEHRHHGVASGMLAAAARALLAIGESELAIAFDGSDPAIRTLLARLGFAAAPGPGTR